MVIKKHSMIYMCIASCMVGCIHMLLAADGASGHEVVAIVSNGSCSDQATTDINAGRIELVLNSPYAPEVRETVQDVVSSDRVRRFRYYLPGVKPTARMASTLGQQQGVPGVSCQYIVDAAVHHGMQQGLIVDVLCPADELSVECMSVNMRNGQKKIVIQLHNAEVLQQLRAKRTPLVRIV